MRCLLRLQLEKHLFRPVCLYTGYSTFFAAVPGNMIPLSLLWHQSRHGSYANSCSIATYPLQFSFYNYRPSLAANATFLSLFSFSLPCFIHQVALSSHLVEFSIALISGCTSEVLGYFGRIMSYHNPQAAPSGCLLHIPCSTYVVGLRRVSDASLVVSINFSRRARRLYSCGYVPPTEAHV